MFQEKLMPRKKYSTRRMGHSTQAPNRGLLPPKDSPNYEVALQDFLALMEQEGMVDQVASEILKSEDAEKMLTEGPTVENLLRLSGGSLATVQPD